MDRAQELADLLGRYVAKDEGGGWYYYALRRRSRRGSGQCEIIPLSGIAGGERRRSGKE